MNGFLLEIFADAKSMIIWIRVIFNFSRAVIGEVDDLIDKRLDFASTRAEPLGSIVHWCGTSKPAAATFCDCSYPRSVEWYANDVGTS